MKKFLISSIIFSILILTAGACAPAPTATSAPSETPEPAFTETYTPTIAFTPTLPPAVESEGYIDKLELVYQSPIREIRFGGADGPAVTAAITVDRSGLSHGIGRVEMPDPLLAETTMRALHSIFAPDEADDDASLAAFANKLAAIQRGDPGVSCADMKHGLEVYDANGNGGAETVTLVPPCGASPVPDGAIELKGGVKFIYGAWYVPNEELQKYVASPDAPWLDIVTGSGNGFGAILDRDNGVLYIMDGVGYLTNPENSVGKVASNTQMMIDWLAKYSQGERFYTKSTEKWAKTSSEMINAGLVVAPK